MFNLGIDVSKAKSDYCIIDEKKKVVRTFSNINNKSGLEKTLKEIKTVSESTSQFTLSLEATGVFWQPVYYFFKDQGYNIFLLNPYSVKHFSQMRLSRTKTDKMDAYQIACCTESGYAKKSIVPDDKILSLRDLIRTRSYFMNKNYDLKRKMLTSLYSVFAEYKVVFKNPFSITSLKILSLFPSSHSLRSVSSDGLIKIFRSIKGNNNVAFKASAIIELAKNSITPKEGILGKELSLKNLINTYIFMDKQLKDIDNQIDSLLNDFETTCFETQTNDELTPISAVLTTPGVGIKTIATIIGSCGDLSMFKTSTSFIGYIGLYPQQYQSGKTNYSFSHKKSIPLVKKQLFCAAVSCLKHNKELRQLYLNLVSKGVCKKLALCKISHKLAKIIWRLYNYKCKYDASLVFTS